jgi:hypothetical protein
LENRETIKQSRLKEKYIYPWTGVDLDKTLAVYNEYISHDHIGEPIPAMVERVQKMLMAGKTVKIFTARMSDVDPKKRLEILDAIHAWTLKHIGRSLEATCIKDYGCVAIYDDRAIQVEPNTGRIFDMIGEEQYENI